MLCQNEQILILQRLTCSLRSASLFQCQLRLTEGICRTLGLTQLYSEKPELENGLLAPSQATLLSGVTLFVTDQLFNLAQLGSGSNRTTSTSHKCVCLSGHHQHIIFLYHLHRKCSCEPI